MSLRRRETEEQDFSLKSLKNTLISVLGLNLVPPMDDNGDIIPEDQLTDDQKESFIPMVLLAGNHHLLSPHVKRVKEALEKQKIGSEVIAADAEFEKLSKALAAGGDMEPIMVGDITLEEAILKKELKDAGVHVLPDDEIPRKIRHHVSIAEK